MTEPLPQVPDEAELVRRVTSDGPTLVLELHGELDGDNSDALYDEVRLVTKPWDGPVALDMAAVSFIDSSVVGCLLRVKQDVGPGQSFTVRAPSANVRRVLSVTGLLGTFTDES